MKESVSAKTLKGALNSPQSVTGKAIPRGNDGISPTVDIFDTEDGHRVVITDIAGPKTFDVKDGKDGEDGYTPVKGVDYFDGEGVYIVEVSESAESRGSNVVIFSNGTKLNVMNGKDGEDGTGVSVVSVTESTKEGGANVVTFSDGTKLTVMNGTKGADGTMTFEDLTDEQMASLKGADGKDGKDGYTPVKGVDYFDGQDGKDGQNGQDGKTPVKGTDYWTASDKSQMVSDVLAALPTWNGGSY